MARLGQSSSGQGVAVAGVPPVERDNTFVGAFIVRSWGAHAPAPHPAPGQDDHRTGRGTLHRRRAGSPTSDAAKSGLNRGGAGVGVLSAAGADVSGRGSASRPASRPGRVASQQRNPPSRRSPQGQRRHPWACSLPEPSPQTPRRPSSAPLTRRRVVAPTRTFRHGGIRRRGQPLQGVTTGPRLDRGGRPIHHRRLGGGGPTAAGRRPGASPAAAVTVGCFCAHRAGTVRLRDGSIGRSAVAATDFALTDSRRHPAPVRSFVVPDPEQVLELCLTPGQQRLDSLAGIRPPVRFHVLTQRR